MKISEKNKYAFLLLVLANMIWGGNFVIGRIGADYFPPITFSLLRWLIPFLVLTPLLFKKLKADWGMLSQRSLRRCLQMKR